MVYLWKYGSVSVIVNSLGKGVLVYIRSVGFAKVSKMTCWPESSTEEFDSTFNCNYS